MGSVVAGSTMAQVREIRGLKVPSGVSNDGILVKIMAVVHIVL